MITGIALFILIPIIFVFYSYSQGTTWGISTSRINNIGNSIVTSAESVYYLGEPSRITIRETMPRGIKNLTILYDPDEHNSELVFLLEDRSEMPFSSNVNITGKFNQSDFTEGMKEIEIESKGNYVLISIS